MSKKFFIGANWKMNPTPAGYDAADSPYHSGKNADVVVFPTFADLPTCVHADLTVGGQCGSPEKNGAHTGDIGMEMLKTIGCTHVLCGHSERRIAHGETDAMIAVQVQAALEAGLIPVLCIGETAKEKANGKMNEVLSSQLSRLPDTDKVIVAYEPVWAIGTGKTPTPEEADVAHAFIRSLLKSKNIRIIYGGSVTASNVKDFFAQKNIDGALVGGASLKPEEFRKIVEAAQ